MSPTQGYAYFYDYSTDVSAEYALTAPAGTVVYGSSVEWVVERPTLGSSLTNLTNYIAAPWAEGVAKSGFLRELNYLLSQGYTYAQDGLTMLPPP